MLEKIDDEIDDGHTPSKTLIDATKDTAAGKKEVDAAKSAPRCLLGGGKNALPVLPKLMDKELSVSTKDALLYFGMLFSCQLTFERDPLRREGLLRKVWPLS